MLDTNVLFAAFLADGLCARLYDACLTRDCHYSAELILAELKEKLRTKGKRDPAWIAEVIEEIQNTAQLVFPEPPFVAVCRDVDDDAILAVAVAARADALVTGDQDLPVLKAHQGIPILTPRQMMERMG